MRKLENDLSTNYLRIFYLKQIFNNIFIDLKELIFFFKEISKKITKLSQIFNINISIICDYEDTYSLQTVL